MGTCTFEIVSSGSELAVKGHLLHKGSDIGHNEVDSWAHKTGWGGHSRTAWGGNNVVYTVSQGFDRTEPSGACSVVNCGTALSILLVVNPKHGALPIFP